MIQRHVTSKGLEPRTESSGTQCVWTDSSYHIVSFGPRPAPPTHRVHAHTQQSLFVLVLMCNQTCHSGSVTEAEEESNHSSFDTTTTASMATTPGSSTPNPAAPLNPLRPSPGAGGEQQDSSSGSSTGPPGGRRRDGLGSGATVTSSLSSHSGGLSATEGPVLASPPLASDAAATEDGVSAEGVGGAAGAGAGAAASVLSLVPAQDLGEQGPRGGEGGGGGSCCSTRALPVLEPPDAGTPAAEALAANAAIPHRGRGSLSRGGSISVGKKSKSLRRLARNLKKKKKRRNFQGNVIKVRTVNAGGV
jgi:hypothetical protein